MFHQGSYLIQIIPFVQQRQCSLNTTFFFQNSFNKSKPAFIFSPKKVISKAVKKKSQSLETFMEWHCVRKLLDGRAYTYIASSGLSASSLVFNPFQRPPNPTPSLLSLFPSVSLFSTFFQFFPLSVSQGQKFEWVYWICLSISVLCFALYLLKSQVLVYFFFQLN